MALATQTRTKGVSPNWSTRTSSQPCRRWSEPWRRSRSPTNMSTTRYLSHSEFLEWNLPDNVTYLLTYWPVYLMVFYVSAVLIFCFNAHAPVSLCPWLISSKGDKWSHFDFCTFQVQQTLIQSKLQIRKKTKRKNSIRLKSGAGATKVWLCLKTWIAPLVVTFICWNDITGGERVSSKESLSPSTDVKNLSIL